MSRTQDASAAAFPIVVQSCITCPFLGEGYGVNSRHKHCNHDLPASPKAVHAGYDVGLLAQGCPLIRSPTVVYVDHSAALYNAADIDTPDQQP